MQFPMIDLAGNLGAGLGQGLANYQQGREARRKSLHEDVLDAWASGDHARAFQLAQEADKVSGLFGPLAPERAGPKLMNRQATRQVPVTAEQLGPTMPGQTMPRVAQTMEQAGPQLPGGLASRAPMMRQETYDTGEVDWNNAANVEAVRKFVGAPAAAPRLHNASPGETVGHLDAAGQWVTDFRAEPRPVREPAPVRPQIARVGSRVVAVYPDGHQVDLGEAPPPAPRAAGRSRGGGSRGGGHASRGIVRTVLQGGKPVQVLFNAATGAPIRVLGEPAPRGKGGRGAGAPLSAKDAMDQLVADALSGKAGAAASHTAQANPAAATGGSDDHIQALIIEALKPRKAQGPAPRR